MHPYAFRCVPAQINDVEVYFSPNEVVLTTSGWKDPSALAVGDRMYRSRHSIAVDAAMSPSVLGPAPQPPPVDDDALYLQIAVSSLSSRTLAAADIDLGMRRHGFIVTNIASWDTSGDFNDGFGPRLAGVEVIDMASPNPDATVITVPLPRHIAHTVKSPRSSAKLASMPPFVPGVTTPNMLGW